MTRTQKIVTVAAGPYTDDQDAVEGRVFVRDVEGTRQRYQDDVATRSTREARLTVDDPDRHRGHRCGQRLRPGFRTLPF